MLLFSGTAGVFLGIVTVFVLRPEIKSLISLGPFISARLGGPWSARDCWRG